jgi:uncharacterized membrane protein YphA (DoxX/SURF4 family)
VVRYFTLHWLLYSFPAPLIDLPRTIFSLWQRLLPDGTPLPAWASAARRAIDKWGSMPQQWWETALTWLARQNMTFGAEMLHTYTIKGDTCAAWVRVFYIVLAAGLLTVVWSLLDRRRAGYPMLGRWLHLASRWYLALAMVNYGWPKLFGGQFPAPTIEMLTRPLGDYQPDGVLWMFMGHSQPYTVLAAIGELLGFALLLHRRTTLLGAFVTACVMANVCALNWLYGVPLKQYSTHLLLISLLLMAPFWRRLWALFVSNGESAPVDLRVVKRGWLGSLLMLVGCVWATAAACDGALRNWQWRQNAMATTHAVPELFGLWEVESMQLAGEPVPLGRPNRWVDIAIDRGNTLRIRSASRVLLQCAYVEDFATGTITLSGTPSGDMAWQFERSVVVRKGFNPAPRRPDDFRSMVDVERDAITIRGAWQSQSFEAVAVKKQFVYDRPFRLISENPR